MAGDGQEGVTCTLFTELPDEIVLHIFKKLSIRGLAVAQCVSKEFRAVASGPELWANVPLIIEKGSYRSYRALNDKCFMEILARAKDIPRINIDVIDFGECYALGPRALEALVQKVDAQALPPTKIDVTGCGGIDSCDLVSFLRALTKKLAARWKKRTTKLWLTSDVYESHIVYLAKFSTRRPSTYALGWPYDFKCHSGCEITFQHARFCSHCHVHTCLCQDDGIALVGHHFVTNVLNIVLIVEDKAVYKGSDDDLLDYEDEDEESVLVSITLRGSSKVANCARSALNHTSGI